MERRLTSSVEQNLCRFAVCDVLRLKMFKKDNYSMHRIE